MNKHDLQPNKIVANLWKRSEELKARDINTLTNTDREITDYFADKYEIGKELAKITCCVGAIEVMSKKNIIRLVAMQSSYRFMEHHSFYIEFSKAAEYTK